MGRTSGWIVVAERLDEYAPAPGDLICYSREKRPVKYEQLPARHFAGHCDIVVLRGNQADQCRRRERRQCRYHEACAGDRGWALDDSERHVLDTRYPWFVALRIIYDR